MVRRAKMNPFNTLPTKLNVHGTGELPPAKNSLGTVTYESLENIIKRYLLIEDKGLIKIIVACVISHRLPVDPVWLLIVAGPGGGKTELLSGLFGLDNVWPLSDLTSQTFMSGDKTAPKGSLLHRLPPEVLIIMKDFTTVLEMNSDKQNAILAQLREIYDGAYGKEFGNGESKAWQGKMGFIAGVTPIIDRRQPIHQALGERFIKYRPVAADSLEVTKRAMKNSGQEKRMREDIKAVFSDYFKGLKLPQTLPEVPEEYQDAIMHLAVFCAKARSPVIRDTYHTREIEDIPEPEHPTRLVKQLLNLMISLAIITGEFTEADYKIIAKVGMDSLPGTRRKIIEYLSRKDSPQTISDIANAVGLLPNTSFRRQLEDMCALKVIDGDSSEMSLTYKLSFEIKTLLTGMELLTKPLGSPEEDNKSDSEQLDLLGHEDATLPEKYQGSMPMNIS